ncbi:Uncharacterized membrane protein YphA, DoxX/SURF4 family [Nocardioides scoriae]|uniref:Uncharacterized membrane protein YphA, DoxX/SURF4 family n=1 Tax=Nocardioides scoriae TaxID=642780 RepID=A0A1H1XU73_9ACTN|nr:DoxX family membrane protein [Nocardioides scoriae]SDT12794.1 Uncharacterized membrane protein YphA, DoxX/SURF4 family [Nocardioides scoriae]
MTVIRLIARPLLASTFAVGAVAALKNAPALAEKSKPVIDRIVPAIDKAAPQLPVPHDALTLVRLNAAVQLVAALQLARGRAPRVSSAVLAASLAPTTVAGHPFWEEKDPQARQAQQLHFFKNLSVLGGLILAAVDTEGQPGVAYRAQAVGRTARREAKHLARESKLSAKLAAKSVTS